MSTSRLAIIIPYFKNDFFEHTLESLSRQTCKDFKVYIGDDHSPHDIRPILEKYQDSLDINYHRFDENLGSASLTKQWERCVDLSQEEWLWLFSDDDIVQENAVEIFYKSVKDENLLYKFETKIIDGKGDVNPYYDRFDAQNKFDNQISSLQFIKRRLKGKGFRSFAVEYVFHRSLYLKNGFIDFPLAWNSDDATWIMYSLGNTGKIDVLDSCVYWRLSTSNITSDTRSIGVLKMKANASMQYIIWLAEVVAQYKVPVGKKYFIQWLAIQIGLFDPGIKLSTFLDKLNKLPYIFPRSTVVYHYLRYIKLRLLQKRLKSRKN